MSDLQKLESITEPQEFLKVFEARDWSWFAPTTGSVFQGTLQFDTLTSLDNSWVDLSQSGILLQYTVKCATVGGSAVANPMSMCMRDLGQNAFWQVQFGLGNGSNNLTQNTAGINLYQYARKQFDMSTLASSSMGSWWGSAPDSLDSALANQTFSSTGTLSGYKNNVVHTSGVAVTGASFPADSSLPIQDPALDSVTAFAVSPPTLNPGARQRAQWIASASRYPANFKSPQTLTQGVDQYNFTDAANNLYNKFVWVPLSMLCDACGQIDIMKGQRIYISAMYQTLTNGSATSATLSYPSGAGAINPWMLTSIGDGSLGASTDLQGISANISMARLYVRTVQPVPSVIHSSLKTRHIFYRDAQIFSFPALPTGSNQTLLCTGVNNCKRIFIYQYASAANCPNGLSPCASLVCSDGPHGTAGMGIGQPQIFVGDKLISQNQVTLLPEMFSFFQRENLLNQGTDEVIASGRQDEYQFLVNGGLHCFDLTKTRATEEDLKTSNIRIQVQLYGPTTLQDVFVVCEVESAAEVSTDRVYKIL